MFIIKIDVTIPTKMYTLPPTQYNTFESSGNFFKVNLTIAFVVFTKTEKMFNFEVSHRVFPTNQNCLRTIYIYIYNSKQLNYIFIIVFYKKSRVIW